MTKTIKTAKVRQVADGMVDVRLQGKAKNEILQGRHYGLVRGDTVLVQRIAGKLVRWMAY